MLMKYLICIFIILAYSIRTPLLYSEERFEPWGAKIRVADNNKKLISPKGILKNRIAKGKFFRVKSVFNGVQGGAFFLIRFFQVAISPQDGPSCRYIPTCSAYGKHAVEKYGALFGSILAGERLLRCNPYNRPGYDPLPDDILNEK